MSNVLEITLPLDLSHFRYPPIKERLEEEDLYQEYVEVAEGAGYIKAMDGECRRHTLYTKMRCVCVWGGGGEGTGAGQTRDILLTEKHLKQSANYY